MTLNPLLEPNWLQAILPEIILVVGGILLMQVLPLYEPVCLETLTGFERGLYKILEG